MGYGFSVIGGRTKNQDSFLVDSLKSLFAVADGIGGGKEGEVASRMSVEGLQKHFRTPSDFPKVFELLQGEIYDYAIQHFGDALMGTTLTAAHIQGGLLSLCHTGDSRCYQLAGSLLRQLTQDHEVYDEGHQGAVLASYLGIPRDIYPLTIQYETYPVRSGEKLLICSDGLYRQLEDSEIVAVLEENSSEPQHAVERLCQKAARDPQSDNVTVVLIELGD